MKSSWFANNKGASTFKQQLHCDSNFLLQCRKAAGGHEAEYLVYLRKCICTHSVQRTQAPGKACSSQIRSDFKNWLLLGRGEGREEANGCFIALDSIFIKAERSNRGECARSVTSLLEPHKPPTGSSLAPGHSNPGDHLATGSVIPPHLTDAH